jgi:hypothetical protein
MTSVQERVTNAGADPRLDALRACHGANSDFVVTSSWDKTCQIWNAATGRGRLTLPLLVVQAIGVG